jgi:hypothetical protein
VKTIDILNAYIKFGKKIISFDMRKKGKSKIGYKKMKKR